MATIEIIGYLAKILTIQGLFLAFYFVALRNSKSYASNRGYLLLTLVASLAIPFIENPIEVPDKPLVAIETTINQPINDWLIAAPPSSVASQFQPEKSEASFDYWQILVWCYFAILAVFTVRSVVHLYFFRRIQMESELINRYWFKLFKTNAQQPFSFLSNVFIPKSIFGTSAYEPILAHECAHVRNWHSADRLLMDFFVSLFWFNPFVYLYRNALIEVHEFQADEAVLRQFGNPIGYQEVLYQQLQPAGNSGLVSHFNYSTIKKRIVMMNKPKNVGYTRLMYVLTLPLVALVLMAFTSKKGEESDSQINTSFGLTTDNLRGIPGVFLFQDDKFKPSILPLKTDSDFRVTSTYGMRNDPFSNGEKMHLGIDLATPVGTEVLATADGEVHKVVTSTAGYGNHIVINHGAEYQTKYAQLSAMQVKVGEKVSQGQIIALSGNSGQSKGPHLHYEVYKNGDAADPAAYIANFEFSRIPSTEEKEKMKLQKQQHEKELELIRKDLEKHELALAKMQAELAKIEAEKEKIDAEKAKIQVEQARIQAEVSEHQAKIAEEMAKQPEYLKIFPENGEESIKLINEGNKAFHFNTHNISGNTKPIYILDGNLVDNIKDVDPRSIQEIEVLTEVAAVKKYGEKGSSGVVIITTNKKGKGN
jgi:murein DD-endopeptidase MepM/ murein hydrolase activator NlpD